MSIRVVILLLLGSFIAGCYAKKSAPADSGMFLASKRLATLTDRQLTEVSGLAASVANRGYLWAHNDSGNSAAIYLIDEDLKIRLTCKLKGVKNRDWEDIAMGPGPDASKRYVHVADIGDNNARYAIKYIYRFEEPRLSDGVQEITITDFDTIAFTLEGEKKDTEAIMVHPHTQDIYIVSKRENPVYLYALNYPFSSGDTLIAKKVMSIDLTQIVAADLSTSGEEILMKNYDQVYYWDTKGKPIEEALMEKPAVLKYTDEPQGESIAFKHDGSGFYTLSETIKGENIYLYFYERRTP